MMTRLSIREYTNLLLYYGQLFKVAFQERHLLLLSLAVAVAYNIVVLLLDLIELDLEFDDLETLSVVTRRCGRSRRTFSQRFCRSRMSDFFTPSNSASWTLIAFRVRSRS